jgi:hypothetical protein
MVAGDNLVAFGDGGGRGFGFGGFAGIWAGLGGGLSARAGALRPGRGVFTLIVSHVRLCMQVDLVRARSVFKHRALPVKNQLLAIGSWPSSFWRFWFYIGLFDEGTGIRPVPFLLNIDEMRLEVNRRRKKRRK